MGSVNKVCISPYSTLKTHARRNGVVYSYTERSEYMSCLLACEDYKSKRNPFIALLIVDTAINLFCSYRLERQWYDILLRI